MKNYEVRLRKRLALSNKTQAAVSCNKGLCVWSLFVAGAVISLGVRDESESDQMEPWLNKSNKTSVCKAFYQVRIDFHGNIGCFLGQRDTKTHNIYQYSDVVFNYLILNWHTKMKNLQKNPVMVCLETSILHTLYLNTDAPAETWSAQQSSRRRGCFRLKPHFWGAEEEMCFGVRDVSDKGSPESARGQKQFSDHKASRCSQKSNIGLGVCVPPPPPPADWGATLRARLLTAADDMERCRRCADKESW